MRKLHGFVNITSQGNTINFLPGILVLLSAARGCIVSRERCGRLRGGSKAFEDGFEHRVPEDSTTCLGLVARGEEKWGVTLWQEANRLRRCGAKGVRRRTAEADTGSLVA